MENLTIDEKQEIETKIMEAIQKTHDEVILKEDDKHEKPFLL